MKTRIPTNIITGFLGVGKTTTILHLLHNKPEHEVWSVLVNEFGEIGIDGALLKQKSAFVREVPGGCICCVAGLPMKIALNMMIATTKPDRIIIEPTGLGHPEEIIHTLTGEYYDSVLDLRATITLIDPRKLSDPRYTENANFQDQIAVADVLVANKMDVCSTDDERAFANMAESFTPPKQGVYRVAHGSVDARWLDHSRTAHTLQHPQHHAANNRLKPATELYNAAVRLPDREKFVRRENRSADAFSCGWLFSPQICFQFQGLFGFLSGGSYWRAKAVMITDEGVFVFNSENGVLSVNQIDDSLVEGISDSRIEIIDDKTIDADQCEKTLLELVL